MDASFDHQRERPLYARRQRRLLASVDRPPASLEWLRPAPLDVRFEGWHALLQTMSRTMRVALAVAALTALGVVVGVLTEFVMQGRPDRYLPFLLVPLLLALGTWIAAVVARRHPEEPWLFRLLVLGVGVKLVASTLRYVTLVVGYDGAGDATLYHRTGRQFADAFVFGNVARPTYETFGQTNFVRWTISWLYVVMGPSMLGGFLVFGFVALWGAYFWYRAAANSVAGLDRRLFLILLLFVPSVAFWPSSIGKEALMLFFLGLMVLGISGLLSNRLWPGAAFLALGGWLAFTVRPHVAAMFVLALAVAYVLGRVRPPPPVPIGSTVSRVVGVSFVIVATISVVTAAASFLGIQNLTTSDIEDRLAEQTEQTSQGGSEFDNANPSLSPTRLPFGIMTVLFRPFPNEATSALAAIAALETTALLLFTAVRWRSLAQAVRNVRKIPFLLFCVTAIGIYSMAFSSFANFGLLARQRSLVLPAYLVLLCLVPRSRASDPVPEQSVAVPERVG